MVAGLLGRLPTKVKVLAPWVIVAPFIPASLALLLNISMNWTVPLALEKISEKSHWWCPALAGAATVSVASTAMAT